VPFLTRRRVQSEHGYGHEGDHNHPIVMTNSVDPVSAGLVAGLARPGGNVTGLASTRRTDCQTADYDGAAAIQARAWVEAVAG
jgi:hypothetical protein